MAALESKFREMAERYKLAAVYVFGTRATEIASRVHGHNLPTESPDSDADIAVQPVREVRLTAQARVRLMIELEELLGVGRVDLVVLPEASPLLALDVIRGELLYCADEDAQAEDELYVLRRAGDLAHFARERQDLILRGESR